MENTNDGVSKERLISDFNVVVADAEALLKATANQSGDKITEVRVKIQDSLKMVKANLEETQAALMAKTKAAAKATDVYVHSNPWEAVGVAASLGLIVGWLIGRR